MSAEDKVNFFLSNHLNPGIASGQVFKLKCTNLSDSTANVLGQKNFKGDWVFADAGLQNLFVMHQWLGSNFFFLQTKEKGLASGLRNVTRFVSWLNQPGRNLNFEIV
jgi:hypothetical protein